MLIQRGILFNKLIQIDIVEVVFPTWFMSVISDLSEALLAASIRSLSTDIILHDIVKASQNDI